MTTRLLTLVLSVVLLAPSIGPAAEKFDIKVLYAGNLGSPRAEDYVALLDKHFASVAAVSYEEFQSFQADGHDVVIFDWTTIYPRDEAGKIDNEQSITMPKPPQLASV